MKYAQCSISGDHYSFDDHVSIKELSDGTYSFVVEHVVHHDAVTIHNPSVEKDGEITEASDNVIDAYDETVIDLVLHVPVTLKPITEDEFKALEKAHLDAAAALPNAYGFAVDIKSNLGGVVAVQSLYNSISLLIPSIQAMAWDEVEALLIDAKTKNIINATQYNAIKDASIKNNIPVKLD